jgi:hypothetical protein
MLLATNSTRVIYLYVLGSDYLLATNLLDLSLGLHRGRPIMSNFRHWATNSLRDKLQILPIFVFILYQMDKPSGICIVSPNTKALTLHSRVVLALNSFILLLFFRVKCVCVALDFWMHFIYKCMSRIFGILCRGGG